MHILPTGLYPEKKISGSTVNSLRYATAENAPLSGSEITLLIGKPGARGCSLSAQGAAQSQRNLSKEVPWEKRAEVLSDLYALPLHHLLAANIGCNLWLPTFQQPPNP